MKIQETFNGILGGLGTATAIPKGKPRNHPMDRSIVKDFEIEDFAGVWYEIARIAEENDQQYSRTVLTFNVDADGNITMHKDSLRREDGTSEVTRARVSVPDFSRQASMKISGMPFTDREINILEVDEGYNFALAGGRSANRLWILSRAPYIPQDDLNYMIARALERGYDLTRLTFTDESAIVGTPKKEEEAYACAM